MIHEKVETPAGTPLAMSRAVRISAWAMFGLLAAYLLWPMLTPVHVEGFTASVASLGIHLREDSLANFDRTQPLNVEFFGLSKLGWMLMISALTGLGLSAAQAMTLLTWVSAAAFAAGSAVLVRRWVKAPLWAIAATLVLFPGVSETAFFYNDNIIASALAVWALCSLYLEKRILGAALCGALFAAATLTRNDTILIGAAVPLILIGRDRAFRPIAISLGVAGAAGAVVLFGTLALFHSTVFDILTAAHAAITAWKGRFTANPALQLFFFLGIPGSILVLGAVLSLIARRDWTKVALLLLVPAIFITILAAQIWEVRQLLPLTPFFVALAASLLADMVNAERTLKQAVQLALVAGITIVTLFGPITGLVSADGPRVVGGRIANIAQWRGWQHNVDRDFELLNAVADVPAGDTRVLLSDFWNDDRYLHLVVQEAGYRLVPSTAQCEPVADQFENGSSRIVIVRLHQVYVPYWRQLSAERLRKWGIPCIDSVKPHDLALVGPKSRIDSLEGRTNYKMAVPDQSALFDGTGSMKAAFLGREDLPGLVRAYAKIGEVTADPAFPVPSIEEAAQTARKRTSFGR